MKNLSFLICVLFACISANAQNSVTLDIAHLIDTEPVEFNSEFTLENGDLATMTRCEYYISEITITHDGGTETHIEDKWILVDAFSPEVYDLGVQDISEVESITFSVGVENPENHDDPSAWPSDHPLAPQNPSMHWGWASGYRFVAIEGNTGSDGPDYTFQVHALGDSNYFEQSIEVSASEENGSVNISLSADYLKAYTNIATESGGISHGEIGDAFTMLENFQNLVFSSDASNSIEEITEEKDIQILISPNPSSESETSNLILDRPENNLEIQIYDLSGKLVHSEKFDDNTDKIELPLLSSGVFMINLKSDETLLGTQRWIIE